MGGESGEVDSAPGDCSPIVVVWGGRVVVVHGGAVVIVCVCDTKVMVNEPMRINGVGGDFGSLVGFVVLWVRVWKEGVIVIVFGVVLVFVKKIKYSGFKFRFYEGGIIGLTTYLRFIL